MGALVGHSRKRDNDYNHNHFSVNRNFSSIRRFSSSNCDFENQDPIFKKPRLNDATASAAVKISGSIVNRISRYPAAPPPIKREIHAPRVNLKYGASLGSGLRAGGGGGLSSEVMGNWLSFKCYEAKVQALRTLKYAKTESEQKDLKKKEEEEDEVVEVIDVEKEVEKDDKKYQEVLDDMVVGEVEEGLENGVEGCSVVTDYQAVDTERGVIEVLGSDVRKLTTTPPREVIRVEDAEKMLQSWSLNADADVGSLTPVHKILYENVQKRNPRLEALNFEIDLAEKKRSFYQSLRPEKQHAEDAVANDLGLHTDEEEDEVEDIVSEAFVPLSDEEEDEVRRALSSSSRRKLLVNHEKSGIQITGEAIQCLRPGTWLNDEVINLYLELLKEREQREPKRFLRCHFFNTFFFKKLTQGKISYDYNAVRRWTTKRKLGYALADCDKIFVPIHLKVHWCMAVINKKEQKFQYIDSLGGGDHDALKTLAQYYVDEVKDKSGEDIDVSHWKLEAVDAPRQENGFDCGVFMIKYMDFLSRGVSLVFNQEHMSYFRHRTAKEILRLHAY